MALFPTRSPLFVPSPLLLLLLLFLSVALAASSGGRGKIEVLQWRRSIAQEQQSSAAVAGNNSFILASERTHRKDPLNNYERYTGGWNISDQHYWASVGFTAVPMWAVSFIWFLGFAVVLLIVCCSYCCCRRRNYSYSPVVYGFLLSLLILFTLSAITGSVVLYFGQGKFHGSTSGTVDYVVAQANLTVNNVRNFSNNLDMAKRVGVDNIFLPSEIQAKIDMVETKLNASANEFSSRTASNSKKIEVVLNDVRLDLVIIAAVMLIVAFFGFLFSVFGVTFVVSILVLIGWILVTGTFILSGIFVLFHNVVADTCVAMDEWVLNPHAHTALDDILPCVDVATANESLYRSKEVTFQLVNVVNQVINNISNANIPPALGPPVYYNQSGPLMPILCNPYTPDMSNRTCEAGEVDFTNATEVWKAYECNTSSTSGFETCSTIGRITPSIYGQMTAAVSVSRGIYYFGPFLTELEDCTFLREVFMHISRENCPGLELYSKWIYIGLAMVSAAVMLSLVSWIIYARERRHRKYNMQFMVHSGQPPLDYKGTP